METETPRRPLIVGIGASAGGLEAIERFVEQVDLDDAMALVIIQHLSPDYDSVMDQLLRRRTSLEIRTALDGTLVEAGNVYLLPPEKEMIVSKGRLFLSERDRRSPDAALPIDVFLRSLAADSGARSAAVILSGTGTDGSRGVLMVQKAGGIVLAQDPETARFDGMPRAAIHTGVVDLILEPGSMPRALRQYLNQLDRAGGDDEPWLAAPLVRVLQALHERTGLDFSLYKPTTVRRRVERRLLLRDEAEDIEAYAERLGCEPGEVDALYEDLLIGVTRFFRDHGAFRRLEETVLPELVSALRGGEELRVWVAGCATGEEAYSLAMLILERFELEGISNPVKIFATDVHQHALDFAGEGVFPEAALEHVSTARRGRWFVNEGDSWRVVDRLRRTIVFAKHNLMEDPPFTRLHLVSCRNVLIYLQPTAQQKAVSLFHFALRPGGVLLLGPSETPGSFLEGFQTRDERWRVYQKADDSRQRPGLRFASTSSARSGLVPPRAAPSRMRLIQQYDALLNRFMPPALLVGPSRELLHVFRGADDLLRVPAGRPSRDLLDLLQDELKVAVTSAMHRTRSESRPLTFRGVAHPDGEGTLTVRVEAVPEPGPNADYLVVFEDESSRETEKAAAPSEEAYDSHAESSLRVTDLEHELRHTRENLQATIEELETSNEELQTTNEELVASNEELQSTNEELQSVNEELYTVNSELQEKIRELAELGSDVDNFLSATQAATVFVDPELRIRRMTPRIEEVFNLRASDVGRPIADFTSNLEHPSLMGELRRVADGGEPYEKEVRDTLGRWWFLRVLPYRGHEPQSAGVVITMVDIGALKDAEGELLRAQFLLDSLMRTVPDAIDFTDEEGRFLRVSPAFAQRFGFDSKRAAGMRLDELVQRPDAADWVARAMTVMENGVARVNEVEPFHELSGAVRWYLSTRMALRDSEGEIIGSYGIDRDITPQKQAEEEAQQAVRRRDAFLAMLSHELRNPLAAVTSAADVLVQKDQPDTTVVQIIRRQAQHMNRLLEDLLDVSRVSQGKVELRRSLVDLRQGVIDAVESATASAEAASIQITHQLPPTPVTVFGDPDRLRQIVSNLLANAIKYGRPGGRAEVSLIPSPDEAVARLEVRDDGVGIEASMLDDIFKVFVQADESLNRSQGGLGLGLALVSRLVRLHGGRVAADSDGLGQGALLTVELPLADARSATTDEADHPTNESSPAPGHLRVALVEDQDDTRYLMRTLLEKSDCEVLEAEDGESGVDLVTRFQPDLALVDVGLPKMTGYEVARRIRERGLRTRLVALTGYGGPQARRQALDAGFDEHETKPLTFERLSRCLEATRADRNG